MSYVLPCKRENKSYIFYVTFWSFHDFQRIPTNTLREVNIDSMQNDFLDMLTGIEDTFFSRRFTSLPEYNEPCALTNFIDSHEAKIVKIDFSLLYQSNDTTQFPHFLSIDVYLLEKEIDIANAY